MATFTADERKQMWKLFKLPPDQLIESTSVYNCLVDDFEVTDTANGDILVPDIQATLLAISTDQAALLGLKAGGPIQSFDADEEGSVLYVTGASNQTGLASRISDSIKEVRDQIDPRGLLRQFVNCAKSIPTI